MGSQGSPGRPLRGSGATILAEVHSAVQGVTGTHAENEQPLKGAGLDSMGEIPDFCGITCCSHLQQKALQEVGDRIFRL